MEHSTTYRKVVVTALYLFLLLSPIGFFFCLGPTPPAVAHVALVFLIVTLQRNLCDMLRGWPTLMPPIVALVSFCLPLFSRDQRPYPVTLLILCFLSLVPTLTWWMVQRSVSPTSAAAYPVARTPLTTMYVTCLAYLALLFDWLFQAGVPINTRAGFLSAYAIALLVLLLFALAIVRALPRGGIAEPVLMTTLSVAVFSVVSLVIHACYASNALPVPSLLGLSAILSVVPFLFIVPAVVLAAHVRPTATRQGARPRWSFAWFHVHLVRSQLLLRAIITQHPTIFAISLPLTLLAAHEVLPHPVTGLDEATRASHPSSRLLDTWTALTTATIAWLAPFAHAIYFLDDTLATAFARAGRHALSNLSGHLLLLGYSAPARRLIRRLVGRQLILDSPNLQLQSNLLLPDGRLAKTTLQWAFIDESGQHLKAAIQDPTATVIAMADITAFLISSADRTLLFSSDAAFVILGLKGNPFDDSTQDVVHISNACFVVSFISERTTGAVHPLMTRLLREQRRSIPTMLMLSAAKQLPLVSTSAVATGLPIHYLMPEQIEGINAGSRLYALYAKLVDLLGRDAVRILLCGRGRRLAYLIDAFLKSLSSAEFKAIQTRRPFCIVSDDPLVVSIAKNTQSVGRSVISVERLVSRYPDHASFTLDTARIDIDFVEASSLDVNGVLDLLRAERPAGIVICEPTADESLQWLHTLTSAISRVQWPNVPPQVLVSAETSQDQLESHLRNALIHYGAAWLDACPDKHRISAELFPAVLPGSGVPSREPTVALDGLIDSLEDPIERIAAMYGAYRREAVGAKATELHACAGDVSGVAAHTIAQLAGLDECSKHSLAAAQLPSLREFRVVTRGECFEVRSLATLEAAGHRQVPAVRRLAAACAMDRGQSTGDQWRAEKKQTVESTLLGSVRDRLSLAALERGHPEFQVAAEEASRDCCGMPTCPVESVQKVAATAMRRIFREEVAVLSNKPGRSSLADVIYDHYSPIVGRVDGATTDAQASAYAGQPAPLAHIRMWCQGSEAVGGTAVALSCLMLRCLQVRKEQPSRKILNLTGVSGYDCHDSRYAVFTCYGVLEEPQAIRTERQLVNEFVREIEIAPVRLSDINRWNAYASSLITFLTNATGKPWVIKPERTRMLIRSA